jgi:hypothetical protein
VARAGLQPTLGFAQACPYLPIRSRVPLAILLALAVQWAERIVRKIDSTFPQKGVGGTGCCWKRWPSVLQHALFSGWDRRPDGKFAILVIETLYFLATKANGASGQRLPMRWSPEDAGRLVVLPRTLRFATSETSARFKKRQKRRSATESTRPLE